MKNILLIAFLCTVISSCDKDNIKLSSSSTTAEYNFTDITAIDIAGDFEVSVDLSSTNKGVQTKFNSSLQSFINVENNNGTLKVYYNKNISVNGNTYNTIMLTAEGLVKVVSSGEVKISINDPVIQSHLELIMSGESDFSARLELATFQTILSGESKMSINGSAGTSDINCAGESLIRDFQFSINNLDINMSGESNVNLTVNETLDITASGESKLHYKGNATIGRQDISGNASLIKVD